MSIFYCLHCDRTRDSDAEDGCRTDPDDPQYLICTDCAEDEADMADLIYAHHLELSL